MVELPKFWTAETLNEALKKRFNIDLTVERILELAECGFMPCSRIDGGPPMFQRDVALAYVRDHLIQHQKARPFPTHFAVFDARTWEGRTMLIPPELALATAHLVEIPMAVYRWPSGVYFLVHDGKVVYVGQSITVLSRMLSHLKDKKFDRILFIPAPHPECVALEAAFIRHLRPPENSPKTYPGPDREYHIRLDAWFGENGPDAERQRIEKCYADDYAEHQRRRAERETRSLPPSAPLSN